MLLLSHHKRVKNVLVRNKKNVNVVIYGGTFDVLNPQIRTGPKSEQSRAGQGRAAPPPPQFSTPAGSFPTLPPNKAYLGLRWGAEPRCDVQGAGGGWNAAYLRTRNRRVGYCDLPAAREKPPRPLLCRLFLSFRLQQARRGRVGHPPPPFSHFHSEAPRFSVRRAR